MNLRSLDLVAQLIRRSSSAIWNTWDFMGNKGIFMHFTDQMQKSKHQMRIFGQFSAKKINK